MRHSVTFSLLLTFIFALLSVSSWSSLPTILWPAPISPPPSSHRPASLALSPQPALPSILVHVIHTLLQPALCAALVLGFRKHSLLALLPGAMAVDMFYGGAANDKAWDISATTDGGVYVTGSTLSKGAGGLDAWTLKLDSSGGVVWDQTAGCSGDDVAYGVDTAADGGCVIVGFHSCEGGRHAFIAKYTTAGVLSGQTCLTSMAEAYAVKSLSVSSGFAVVGKTSGWYSYITKLTTLLGISWGKQGTQGGFDTGSYSGVVENSAGNLAAVGPARGYLRYGYGTYGYSSGNEISETTSPYGCCWDFMNSLVILSGGDVVLIGSTNSADSSQQNYYIWAKRTSFSGSSTSWSTTYGNTVGDSYGRKGMVLSSGNIMIIGNTTSHTAGGLDIWIVIVSPSDGSLVKAYTYGFSGDDSGAAVTYYATGNYNIFAGYSYYSSASQIQYYVNYSVPCGPGTYAIVPTGACPACAAGTCQPGYSKTSCDACAVGTYQNQAGQPTCTNCAAGTYQPATGTTSCLQCGVGTHQSATGQTSCDDCIAGTYQDLVAQANCKDCVAGTYQTATKSTGCIQCVAGTHQAATGKTYCDDCLAGTYQDQTAQANCKACLAGTYQPGTKSLACIQCAAGSVQPATGQTSCGLCPAGAYQNQLGQTACTVCPAGTSQPASGSTGCVSCSVGTSQSGTGKTSCDACVPGSYQEQTGKSSCTSCAAGTYQPASGSTGCIQCAPGTYQALTGQTACNVCASGSYQSQSGQTSCVLCSAGTYQPSTQSTACIQCSPGTFQSSPGKPSCDSCPAGTYQNQSGQSSCTSCPIGYYGTGTAQTSCVQCLPGSCQSATGKTACDLCQKMQYQDLYGQASCKACGDTMYQDLTGQIACKPCLTNCKTCTTAVDCSQCISGLFIYQSSPGVLTCVSPCPIGYYGNIADDICHRIFSFSS